MSKNQTLVEKAAQFAMEAHNGQTRKYTGAPYWTHPNRVAHLVAQETDDPEVIAAAYLHDTVEDTAVTLQDIDREFGTTVTGLVNRLTNRYTKEAYPEWNREKRKMLEANRLAHVSDEAKLIKRMDIADNTADIVRHDPAFAKVYLKEKAYLLERMGF